MADLETTMFTIDDMNRCPLCRAPMDPDTQDPEQPFCDICCGFLLAELRQQRIVLVEPLEPLADLAHAGHWAPPDTIDGLTDLERSVGGLRRRY